MRRGAAAGAVAAVAWAAAEPLARRALRTTYSDVRLLGRLVPGPFWRPVGLVSHVVNGALFGAAFEELGGRGPKQAILAAQVENAVLWPGLAVIDRIHPDVRSGEWPRLLGNGRVFVQEAAMHALYGAILGVIVRDRRSAG